METTVATAIEAVANHIAIASPSTIKVVEDCQEVPGFRDWYIDNMVTLFPMYIRYITEHGSDTLLLTQYCLKVYNHQL